MFDETQINSYNCITAPADLKQKVLTACETTTPVKMFPPRQTLYKVAPLAACLLLLVSVFVLNQGEPLILQAGDLQLSNVSQPLSSKLDSAPVAEPASYGVRICSLEPEQYTVTLTGNQSMEILSADGSASFDEDGNIIWTVMVPTQDMVYELFLLAEDDTYYVPLRYNVQDGSFSIRYEAQ